MKINDMVCPECGCKGAHYCTKGQQSKAYTDRGTGEVEKLQMHSYDENGVPITIGTGKKAKPEMPERLMVVADDDMLSPVCYYAYGPSHVFPSKAILYRRGDTCLSADKVRELVKTVDVLIECSADGRYNQKFNAIERYKKRKESLFPEGLESEVKDE